MINVVQLRGVGHLTYNGKELLKCERERCSESKRHKFTNLNEKGNVNTYLCTIHDF